VNFCGICLGNFEDIEDDGLVFIEDICRGETNFKKLPSPFDEHGYFECFKGETTEKLCPGKQLFNKTTGKCITIRKNVPKNIKKVIKPVIKPVKIIYKPKKTTPRPIRMVRDTHLKEEINICAGQPNWKMFKSPNACEEYFMCINEIPHIRQCTNDKWFEETRQECVIPRQSTCKRKAPEGYCDTIMNFQMLESQSSCEEYFMCVNGMAYFYHCPENEWFDQKRQKCDAKETSECALTKPPPVPHDICVGVSNFKYVRNPYNCTQYYQCIVEQPYFRSCKDKKFFDEERQMCDFPEKVECIQLMT